MGNVRGLLVFAAFGCGPSDTSDSTTGDSATTTTEPVPKEEPPVPVTQDNFSDLLTEAICDKFFECSGATQLALNGWSSVEDCYAMANETTMPILGFGECEGFDIVAAQLCVDTFVTLDCLAFPLDGPPPECDSGAICG